MIWGFNKANICSNPQLEVNPKGWMTFYSWVVAVLKVCCGSFAHENLFRKCLIWSLPKKDTVCAPSHRRQKSAVMWLCGIKAQCANASCWKHSKSEKQNSLGLRAKLSLDFCFGVSFLACLKRWAPVGSYRYRCKSAWIWKQIFWLGVQVRCVHHSRNIALATDDYFWRYMWLHLVLSCRNVVLVLSSCIYQSGVFPHQLEHQRQVLNCHSDHCTKWLQKTAAVFLLCPAGCLDVHRKTVLVIFLHGNATAGDFWSTTGIVSFPTACERAQCPRPGTLI